jgi:hypothetical protein
MIEVAIVGIPWSPYAILNPIYQAWLKVMKAYNEGSGDGLKKGIYTGGISFTWM